MTSDHCRPHVAAKAAIKKFPKRRCLNQALESRSGTFEPYKSMYLWVKQEQPTPMKIPVSCQSDHRLRLPSLSLMLLIFYYYLMIVLEGAGIAFNLEHAERRFGIQSHP